MVALGIAYMIFGNTIVDPSLKSVTADKQDWVSKTIMGIQVSICYITCSVVPLTDGLLGWIDCTVYGCYQIERTVIAGKTGACFG